jgi:oxepin-CoA hydrolase/3-oxo-5,6-dehydrosuberyl-CoA semialdehyde dehydrogenase
MEKPPFVIKDYLFQMVPLKLKMLKAVQKPLWGGMSAQHMTEHLEVFLVSLTILSQAEPAPLSEFQKGARAMLHSNKPMPRHIENPLYKNGLPVYTHADIEISKEKLLEKLKLFYRIFEQNPQGKNYNPIFGHMNFEDLELLVYKHITHHFTQFGLLPEKDPLY